MARYAVLDGDTIVNVIEWDGKTEYDPGEGLRVMPEADIPKKEMTQTDYFIPGVEIVDEAVVTEVIAKKR